QELTSLSIPFDIDRDREFLSKVISELRRYQNSHFVRGMFILNKTNSTRRRELMNEMQTNFNSLCASFEAIPPLPERFKTTQKGEDDRVVAKS
ncbi:hypothetical protein PFISCL1PPCAC_7353, partial [Pristionchus fissidentatus]